MWLIRGILQLVGLVVVIWFVIMAYEEYAKIRQGEKEDNEHG